MSFNSRLRAGTLVLAMLLVLGACGNDTENGEGSGKGGGPLNVSSTDKTQAIVLSPQDMGAAWKEVAPAKELVVVQDDCAHDELAVLAAQKSRNGAQGAGWAGPILQRGEARRYVRSSALAFPNEDTAKAYLVKRRSPGYVECQRARYSSDEAAAGSKLSYATKTAADPPGDGRDGVLTVYQAQNGDGTPAAGQIARYIWREGANVLTVQQEAIPNASTDPAGVDDMVNNELKKAVTAALARAKN